MTDERIEKRANILQGQRLSLFDSLHLALAEAYEYDILLTTDDDFMAVAKVIPLTVPVKNPVAWLLEVL